MFQGAESQSASQGSFSRSRICCRASFARCFSSSWAFLVSSTWNKCEQRAADMKPRQMNLVSAVESALLAVVLQQFLRQTTYTISIQEWLMLWGWHHSQQLLNFLPLGILFVLQRFFSLLAFLACLLKNQCDRAELQRRRTHHGLSSQCPKK